MRCSHPGAFREQVRFLRRQFLQDGDLHRGGQVLSADHACRAAVARLLAHRLARGQGPCSAETGAYCGASAIMTNQFQTTGGRAGEVVGVVEEEEEP